MLLKYIQQVEEKAGTYISLCTFVFILKTKFTTRIYFAVAVALISIFPFLNEHTHYFTYMHSE